MPVTLPGAIEHALIVPKLLQLRTSDKPEPTAHALVLPEPTAHALFLL
jgi:hypothetical protein